MIQKNTIASLNLQAMHADGENPFILQNGQFEEGRDRKNSDVAQRKVEANINKVDNKIVAFRSTYVWKMRNFGRVDITGVDLSADTRFFLAPRYTVDINASYTYQKAIDKTDSSAKNYNDQIPYTPEHRYSARVTLASLYGTLSYTVLHVGERYYLKQNIPVNKMSAYDEDSLTYFLDWTIGGVDCRWSVSCINIFDEQYDIVKFYPMLGRSWKFCFTSLHNTKNKESVTK